MFPSSTRKTDDAPRLRRFADEFAFIPVIPEHLDYFGYVMGEEPPPAERILGKTMIALRTGLPCGFLLAWFRDTGAVTVHAYFGDWLKAYPKDILRAMKPVMDDVRAQGVTEVWAIADERIAGSDRLVRWFGGEPTDQIIPEYGRYWRIDLRKSPI